MQRFARSELGASLRDAILGQPGKHRSNRALRILDVIDGVVGALARRQLGSISTSVV